MMGRWYSLKEAAEQVLRSQATRTDENFFGAIHVKYQLALLRGHASVFLCKRRWDTEAAEVSVRRDW